MQLLGEDKNREESLNKKLKECFDDLILKKEPDERRKKNYL